jgi:glycine/D-amino acid oxidase-like deaminating enzyme
MDVDVLPDAQPLEGDRQCDVAIIGSGIAGISTAYELASRGREVVVVDRGRIAGVSPHELPPILRRFAMI